jgi:hypothetical protein
MLMDVQAIFSHDLRTLCWLVVLCGSEFCALLYRFVHKLYSLNILVIPFVIFRFDRHNFAFSDASNLLIEKFLDGVEI